ncbi:MAG: hypothetical protein BIFFINMI_02060 [Phycisphaerae bacterium]|nr:hypothetical protein [Phycisphaerae bacterium]
MTLDAYEPEPPPPGDGADRLAGFSPRWGVGLAWVAGVLAAALAIFQLLVSAADSVWLVVFLFILVLHAVVVRWIYRWSGWSVWYVGVAIASPVLFFGVFGVIGGVWGLAIFGAGLAALPGCLSGLRQWVSYRISLRRLRRMDRERADRLAAQRAGGYEDTFADAADS